MPSDATDAVAARLTEAGYAGLFLSGDHSSADVLWRGGDGRAALEEIVEGQGYGDLPRVLALEVLCREEPGYSTEGQAAIYARALALTGIEDGPMHFSGNEWGFMYHADKEGGDPHGALGQRLLEAGEAAVPHLADLLDDSRRIYYVGSQDATLGNGLVYRVKDAAAYYIGKIAALPVQFHQDTASRDQEIERLRATLHDRRLDEHQKT